MSERVLIIKRVLPASPMEVFRAWTDPAVMSRWFFAGSDWSVTAVSDLRVGGAYRVDMRAPDGSVHSHSGTYREITPPDRLAFTWSNELVQDSLDVLEFRLATEGTELLLAHHLPEDPEVYAQHEAGWSACLRNLEIWAAQA
jgi:uncharacterized protein YndB with AHSA1/START domain